MESLNRKGTSPNIASFVGAATVRVHELGYPTDRPAQKNWARMKELVRVAMEEGQ